MVKIFVPIETAPGETRVAATPETIKKLIDAGCDVTVAHGAGQASHISDADFEAAGASIAEDSASAWAAANIVLKVREPQFSGALGRHEQELCSQGSILVSHYMPSDRLDDVRALRDAGVTCFSMNLVPRISRAQRMDALSSQANIGGYKAVLLAAVALPRYFPLMMTAAGTVKPAKVVVMGAGVAGLQAIATAKRLGAQVFATDVRIAVKEQVESLGAKFIDVPGMEDMEDAGGYAKEATKDFKKKQQEVVGDQIAVSDVVITTALIPGRPAPMLVPLELVERMKPGSVIVDMAAAQGGNCAATVANETITHSGVTVIGETNLPATVSVHASELYARNVLAFLLPTMKEGAIDLDFEDEVIAGAAVTHAGEIKHAPTAEALSGEESTS